MRLESSYSTSSGQAKGARARLARAPNNARPLPPEETDTAGRWRTMTAIFSPARGVGLCQILATWLPLP